MNHIIIYNNKDGNSFGIRNNQLAKQSCGGYASKDQVVFLRFYDYCLTKKEGRKEMFYLTTHSTHFTYGYMASDIW